MGTRVQCAAKAVQRVLPGAEVAASSIVFTPGSSAVDGSGPVLPAAADVTDGAAEWEVPTPRFPVSSRNKATEQFTYPPLPVAGVVRYVY